MKWISVLKRLPDDTRDVLVFCPRERNKYAIAFYCDDSQAWRYPVSAADFPSIVTHRCNPQPPESKR